MPKTSRILGGILASLILTEPVAAVAQEACLQHNRLKNWRAVNAGALLYTDWTGKKLLVTFRAPCPNLTHGGAILVLGSDWMELSCLRRGDAMRFGGFGLATSICRVASVEFAEPERAAG